MRAEKQKTEELEGIITEKENQASQMSAELHDARVKTQEAMAHVAALITSHDEHKDVLKWKEDALADALSQVEKKTKNCEFLVTVQAKLKNEIEETETQAKKKESDKLSALSLKHEEEIDELKQKHKQNQAFLLKKMKEMEGSKSK